MSNTTSAYPYIRDCTRSLFRFLKFYLPIRQNVKNVVQIWQKELSVVRLVELGVVVGVFQERKQKIQTRLRDVSFAVLETPHDGVNDMFLWCRWYLKKSLKSVCYYGCQQQVELNAMLGIIYHIFCNHFQRAAQSSPLR